MNIELTKEELELIQKRRDEAKSAHDAATQREIERANRTAHQVILYNEQLGQAVNSYLSLLKCFSSQFIINSMSEGSVREFTVKNQSGEIVWTKTTQRPANVIVIDVDSYLFKVTIENHEVYNTTFRGSKSAGFKMKLTGTLIKTWKEESTWYKSAKTVYNKIVDKVNEEKARLAAIEAAKSLEARCLVIAQKQFPDSTCEIIEEYVSNTGYRANGGRNVKYIKVTFPNKLVVKYNACSGYVNSDGVKVDERITVSSINYNAFGPDQVVEVLRNI